MMERETFTARLEDGRRDIERLRCMGQRRIMGNFDR